MFMNMLVLVWRKVEIERFDQDKISRNFNWIVLKPREPVGTDLLPIWTLWQMGLIIEYLLKI